MKKLHFSLMAILFALFAMVSFTACSSDDDDAPSQESIKENIVGGKWIPTHVSGWEYYGSGYEPGTGDDDLFKPIDKDLDIEEDDYEAWTFASDMTCYSSYFYNGSWHNDSRKCSYSIAGNKLTIDKGEFIFDIISITNKKMVVEYLLEDKAPDKKVRLTFEKAN